MQKGNMIKKTSVDLFIVLRIFIIHHDWFCNIFECLNPQSRARTLRVLPKPSNTSSAGMLEVRLLRAR